MVFFLKLKEHHCSLKRKKNKKNNKQILPPFPPLFFFVLATPGVSSHFPEGVLFSFNQSQELRPLQGLVFPKKCLKVYFKRKTYCKSIN